MNKYQINTALDNMDRFGGSFVASLAFCYSQADPDNQTILYNAFESTFIKYAKFNENKTVLYSTQVEYEAP